LELDPLNKKLVAVLYANRATAHKTKGDLAKAIEDCASSIEANPNYSKAYLKRGDIYDTKGNYEDAIRDYSKV